MSIRSGNIIIGILIFILYWIVLVPIALINRSFRRDKFGRENCSSKSSWHNHAAITPNQYDFNSDR